MQIQTEKERDRANFLLQMMVAIALIGLVFLCVGAVTCGYLKADSAVVGSAFTMFIVLVNFCFPNSIGAAKQQDTINKLADKTPPVTGEAKEALDESNARADQTSAGSTGGGAGIAPILPRTGAGADVAAITPGTIPTDPPAVRVGEEVQPRS
jgi:ABC-type uncharacterized transport system permease subunit